MPVTASKFLHITQSQPCCLRFPDNGFASGCSERSFRTVAATVSSWLFRQFADDRHRSLRLAGRQVPFIERDGFDRRHLFRYMSPPLNSTPARGCRCGWRK